MTLTYQGIAAAVALFMLWIGPRSLADRETAGGPRPPGGAERTQEERMLKEIQVQDRYVTLNGLRFHYREWGSPEAPPLLILHGLTGHAWEFDRVASALSDRFRVLALNQRGHGASAWAEDYSPEVMADDVAAFVDALGLERVQVVGHSMGGVNGWWFAGRYPEKIERLVILDIEPEVLASEEAAVRWATALRFYEEARYGNPEEAVAEYLDGYGGAHREELRTFVINNLAETDDEGWRWRFDAGRLLQWMDQMAGAADEQWSVIRRVQCPTLVIRASDSSFTDRSLMERMAGAIPESRFAEIAGAGHDVHIDQREVLLRELRAFLVAE